MNPAAAASVSCTSDSWYQDRLLNCYRALRLLPEGRWIPALVRHRDYLTSVTSAEVGKFLEEVERHQRKNHLVASFLPSLGEQDWDGLYQELPKIATFGLCLERLTFLARHHDGLLEKLIIHFRNERKRNLRFFLWLKIRSIEHPMSRIFVRRAGKIPKRYFRWALITNILEASAADLCKGYANNALVGLKLSIRLTRKTDIRRKGHVVTFAPADTG